MLRSSINRDTRHLAFLLGADFTGARRSFDAFQQQCRDAYGEMTYRIMFDRACKLMIGRVSRSAEFQYFTRRVK